MSDTPLRQAESERAQQRCNQVLIAATNCFRHYGFHGCSMAQLAKEAGMSVGHIYHYFQNKEAIIDAIVKRDLYECIGAIDQLRQGSDMFQDMVNGIRTPVENSLNPENAALQFEILAEAARNPKVASMVQEAHLHVRQIVSELIACGCKRPLSTAEIDSKIDLIGTLFDGLMVRAIRCPDIDIEQLLPVMRSTVLFILEY
jgi:AcrR family transcriptional regulator